MCKTPFELSVSYSAVLGTLLKELPSQQVFLFSFKVERNALVVLLCGFGA